MRIVAISDTHGLHHEMGDLPEGDVLIVTGDITSRGKEGELISFNNWMSCQPHKHKLVVFGNHDWAGMRFLPENPFGSVFSRERQRRLTSNYTLLMDSAITIEGVKFYGAPWTPIYYDWAFMLPKANLYKIWQRVPRDTNVLLSHGPAWGMLDYTKRGDHAGDETLGNRMLELPDLWMHCFGHIHEGSGFRVNDQTGTLHVNASVLDENYKQVFEPKIIDLDLAREGFYKMKGERNESTI